MPKNDPDPVVFICSKGQPYTEIEMEQGMLHSTMRYLMEINEAEWNLESDLQTELELAKAEISGGAECPWPWYADEPSEIQEPEVFGP